MALVLCTGVDTVLIRTRQLVLQKAGHKVVTAIDVSAVIAACQQNAFDVAVIGQAGSGHIKRQIMALIREYCPATKVLELYRFSMGRVLEEADAWLEVPVDVPQELAEHVSALAAQA